MGNFSKVQPKKTKLTHLRHLFTKRVVIVVIAAVVINNNIGFDLVIAVFIIVAIIGTNRCLK